MKSKLTKKIGEKIDIVKYLPMLATAFLPVELRKPQHQHFVW